MQRTRLIWAGVACLLACAVLFLALGLWLGGHPGDLPTGLQKVFVDKNERVRAQLIDDIQDSYFKSVPKSKLEQASLNGIVQSLGDRFSHYFTPAESRLFNKSVSGQEQFSGIGTTVAEDKRGLAIQEVFPGAPAARAGIRKGDVIVAVNGKSIAGEPSKLATAQVRRPAGTSVTLTPPTAGGRGPGGTSVPLPVLPPSTGRKRTVSVKRARLRVPEVVGTGVVDR